MIKPEVLLISNKFDFSTDFVAVELDKQSICYLRINRDELKNYKIEFDPITPRIKGSFEGYSFLISKETLKSIYYRAPTFLRDIFQEEMSEEEQLNRTQWAAFVRSLCVFENAKWLNNPTQIYKAEIKPYQLYLANKIGFNIPKTLVSNSTVNINCEYVAIKSIDTAIVHNGDEEGFVYTEIYHNKELREEIYTSPFFIQEGLIPKIDIRVTVIENNVSAVSITTDTDINNDWRRQKDKLIYTHFDLPEKIKKLSISLVKRLNLNFGAIDLIFYENDFYFIEINPTGEWSWLQQNTGFRFDKLIVNSLINA